MTATAVRWCAMFNLNEAAAWRSNPTGLQIPKEPAHVICGACGSLCAGATGEGEQLCPTCQREHAEWYAEVFHGFSAEERQAWWAEDAVRYQAALVGGVEGEVSGDMDW